MPAEPAPRRFWLKINRIESLADGIFAISMTLLVLGLEVPRVSQETATTDLYRLLVNDWPRFEDYALSFLLLALFWIAHHRQFHFIRRVNESFLWLNIIVLMLVALVPFTTSVMSTYDGILVSALLFEANLLAIGLVYFCMWYYATDDYRLVDPKEITVPYIRSSRRMNLVIPVVSLSAMAVALVTPGWSELPYIACPFIIGSLRHRADLKIA